MEEYRFHSTVKERPAKSMNSDGERICLATGDMLCIAVDKLQGNIMLRGTERPDITSSGIFRKKVLEIKSCPSGRLDTAAFALDCHQDFYLTTSSRGHLELNFCTSIPSVGLPDERTFDVYFTKQGPVLIQPKLYPNMYLHHRDQVLSVNPLDLNESCHEEYLFHFDAIREDPEQKVNKKIISADIIAIEDITNNPVSNLNRAKVNDISMKKKKLVKKMSSIIELPLRKSAKIKTSWSILFFGCFSDIRKRAS